MPLRIIKFKRKVNPFHVYATEQRKKLKVDMPNLPRTEVFKLIAERWKNMTAEEKSPFVKRPLNPFMIFAAVRRKEMHEDDPSLKNREISKLIGAEWKEMSDAERAPYAEESTLAPPVERDTTSVPSYNAMAFCGIDTIKYLNQENLTTLPQDVLDDHHVKVLHIKQNLLKTLPPSVSSLTSLVELNLDSNMIVTLPPELSFLVSLEKLDLSKNQLTAIPESVFTLKKLRNLSLFRNMITNIGTGISKLKNLENLMLTNNKLSVFPRELCYCANLRTLHMSSNEIALVPKEIIHLQKLEKLSLTHNKIKLVPFNFPLLESLKMLDLYHNSLLAVPANICALTNVHCHLKRSPASLMQMVGEENTPMGVVMDGVRKLVKSQYGCQLAPFEKSPIPLKEMALRKVGKMLGGRKIEQPGGASSPDFNRFSTEEHGKVGGLTEFDFIKFSPEEQLLPSELLASLRCPSGVCQTCGCLLYTFTYFDLYNNEMMERMGCRMAILESGRDLMDANEINVLLFCSANCHTPFMQILL